MEKTPNNHDRSLLRSKDTSANTQRNQMITLIRENQSMSTPEFREHGIMQPASRILELKERGWPIEKVLETYVDSTGKKHIAVARYYFSSNPPANNPNREAAA